MSSRTKPIAIVLSIAAAALGLGVMASGSVSAAAPTWETTFRDDFNGSGLPNSTDWRLTLGTAYPGGPAAFGTGEIQTMTDDSDNVDVRNGSLYITPQRDNSGAWTSARVETNRANFKPAPGDVMRVESRVQMPNVTGPEAFGYWPAFWMLGSPYRSDTWSWPGIGEIDIMENVQGLNWSYGVLHCGTWGGPCNEPEGLNNGGKPCQVTTCQGGFHTYRMEWDRSGSSDQMRWYIDGTLTHKVDEDQVPAATWTSLSEHAGYFIILNVAIGGAFPNKLGGGPSADTKPGVPMLVDYVQVQYAGGQVPPTTPATPTTTTPTTTTPTTTPTTTTPDTTTASPTTTGPTTTTTTATATTSAPSGTGPSNLHVVSTTANTIKIGWDGSAATSYDILRSGERIASITGTNFTDIGLLPNTPYLYSVRANGTTTPVLTAKIGSTPTSSPTEPTPPAGTTTDSVQPTAGTPSGLKVTGTTDSTITIGWAGSTTGSYDVLRSGVRIATITGTSFTDTGLFKNTPYLYSVSGGGSTTPILTATIS
jgi:hypothetical protein